VEIHRSAKKHGVGEEDLRHAVANSVFAGDLDDGSPLRVLYLGPDRAGNLLEGA